MKTQTPVKLETPNIIRIDLKMLRPNPWQPPARLIVPEDECKKWGEDILKNGLRQIPVGRGKDGVYEVADGWQRKNWFEWLVKTGHPEYGSLPVNLQELTDEQMAEYPEATDESKKKMTIIDRAWSWRKRLADFPKTTQTEFAEARGITQSFVANIIRLLGHPESIQQDIIFQKISVTHGIALLSLKEPAVMLEFAENVKNFGWSVANLEQNIKVYLAAQKPKLIDEAEPIQSTIDTFIPPAPVETKPPIGARAPSNAANPLQDIAGDQTQGEGEAQEATIPDCCVDCGNQDHCDHSYAVPGKHGAHECEHLKPIIKGTVTEKLTANERAGLPKVDGNTKAIKLAPAKKEPPKPPAKTPASAKPAEKPAAPAKPKWQRKLVLEEKKGVVMASYGKVGAAMPKYANIDGTLEDALSTMGLRNFMTNIEAEWLKEGK